MKTAEQLFNEWIIEMRETKQSLSRMAEAELFPLMKYERVWVAKESQEDFDRLSTIVKEARIERDEHRKQDNS